MQEEVLNSFLWVKTYLKLIYSFKNIKNGENWAYFEVKKTINSWFSVLTYLKLISSLKNIENGLNFACF